MSQSSDANSWVTIELGNGERISLCVNTSAENAPQVVDWRGVFDEHGQEVPFSPQAFEILQQQFPQVLDQLVMHNLQTADDLHSGFNETIGSKQTKDQRDVRDQRELPENGSLGVTRPAEQSSSTERNAASTGLPAPTDQPDLNTPDENADSVGVPRIAPAIIRHSPDGSAINPDQPPRSNTQNSTTITTRRLPQQVTHNEHPDHGVTDRYRDQESSAFNNSKESEPPRANHPAPTQHHAEFNPQGNATTAVETSAQVTSAPSSDSSDALREPPRDQDSEPPVSRESGRGNTNATGPREDSATVMREIVHAWERSTRDLQTPLLTAFRDLQLAVRQQVDQQSRLIRQTAELRDLLRDTLAATSRNQQELNLAEQQISELRDILGDLLGRGTNATRRAVTTANAR